ncbi:hypothetical protein [Leptolyngbya sp. BC1307]|uniref:hypothetical protein n=1 Tax=Leptolyngbya sp. BC1307 TaxID=2029589 RepID=UPI001F0B0B5E|nr:hypothetical protein [Leptolyngbya sp. BC1307]
MSNPFISNSSHRRRTCRAAQPTAISHSGLYEAGCQQALTDFAIADLLRRIKAHSNKDGVALTQVETEAIAAILIQALVSCLDSNILTTYIDAIRHMPHGTATLLNKLHLPRPATDFPAGFPDVESPRFLDGDHLRWKTNEKATDCGIVIGRFYSFASHCRCWRWCYLIWLDADSPSSAWVRTDIAWEDDLEPSESELRV